MSLVYVVALVAGILLLIVINRSLVYIPNNRIGVMEKLVSGKGSVRSGLIALEREAGYQADLLRGGWHFGLWRWQYRVHKVPLVTIPQGKIGYVYARDGDPLPPSQTLASPASQQLPGRPGVPARRRPAGAAAHHPARGRLRHQPGPVRGDGRGRHLRPAARPQRDAVAPMAQLPSRRLPAGDHPRRRGQHRHRHRPRRPVRTPARSSPRRSATTRRGPDYHNNFQDPEAFLRAGGRRGRQSVPSTAPTSSTAGSPPSR